MKRKVGIFPVDMINIIKLVCDKYDISRQTLRMKNFKYFIN